jgi:ABC-type multidrug transport system fused ATPase/permease subunit
LKGISFAIEPGQTVAIVGPTGAGKSTLSRILFRFYNIASGIVRIDGQDLNELTQASVRQALGIVPQDTVLFNDTIANNISYGSPDASREQVIEAATKAHAIEFIEALTDGFDTQLGSAGQGLSGGQRQRISLARAILKDPELLILDEATSQIDPESERLIHSTLAEFIRNRTTIMITHRLSTLDLVDQIVVMRDGQVLDLGTHEGLLSRCADYLRMRTGLIEEAA